MNNTELLKISEYAEIKGITKQAVYKQLNNKECKLNNYLKVVDGQKYIDIKALEDIELNEVKQPFNNPIKQVEQQFNDGLINLLEKQLEEKDKQIQTLLKQIEDLHTLLSQSQQLQAADKQLLLENQKKKKKGLLKLFSKRGAADNEGNI